MGNVKYPFSHIPNIPPPCKNCEQHGAGVYGHMQERSTGGAVRDVSYILCNCSAAKYIQNYYKFEAAMANDEPPKLHTMESLFGNL